MQNSHGISLARALRVERGAVVSFVGGGGKTTSMFRLAAELSAASWRVVTTTTTHISEEQARLAPASIRPDELFSLGARLDEFGHCLIVGMPDGKGRVQSVSPDLIAGLKTRSDIDCILVEADGSRSLPFKAPGKHEPVVPGITTILVPIAGLNAIGMPLDEAHVHRAEIAAQLAHTRVGSRVSPEIVARVLSHPRGGAKQLPPGARLVPLLNKADDGCDMRRARVLAEKLAANPAVDAVLICSMRNTLPVREAWSPTAAVILAAGKSTRFGVTKQILPWRDTTLAARSAQVALEAGLSPVIVVIGHDAENVSATLTGLPVQVVLNPDYASGQSSSVRRGIDALPSRAGAALFLLADQPLIDSTLLRKIVRAHRKTLAPACVPVFRELRGNPVLFDRTLFAELRTLEGDVGGRALLDHYRDSVVEVPATQAALLDIDKPEDYELLKGESRRDTGF
jgi:molybdenum cofactor cytidylyltransferase